MEGHDRADVHFCYLIQQENNSQSNGKDNIFFLQINPLRQQSRKVKGLNNSRIRGIRGLIHNPLIHNPLLQSLIQDF